MSLMGRHLTERDGGDDLPLKSPNWPNQLREGERDRRLRFTSPLPLSIDPSLPSFLLPSVFCARCSKSSRPRSIPWSSSAWRSKMHAGPSGFRKHPPAPCLRFYRWLVQVSLSSFSLFIETLVLQTMRRSRGPWSSPAPSSPSLLGCAADLNASGSRIRSASLLFMSRFACHVVLRWVILRTNWLLELQVDVLGWLLEFLFGNHSPEYEFQFEIGILRYGFR